MNKKKKGYVPVERESWWFFFSFSASSFLPFLLSPFMHNTQIIGNHCERVRYQTHQGLVFHLLPRVYSLSHFKKCKKKACKLQPACGPFIVNLKKRKKKKTRTHFQLFFKALCGSAGYLLFSVCVCVCWKGNLWHTLAFFIFFYRSTGRQLQLPDDDTHASTPKICPHVIMFFFSASVLFFNRWIGIYWK